jgi:hypothetical protein
VPDNAVILGPNKFGKAMVWLWPHDVAAFSGSDSNLIICFMPGSEV